MANDIEQLKQQGNAAFSAGDHTKAVKLFSDAIALDPSNAVLYSNRSASFASLREYQRALEDAESCIQHRPDWAKGYGRKGAALHGLARYDEAVKAFDAGLKYEPQASALLQGKQAALEAAEELNRLNKGQMPMNPFSDPSVFAKLRAHPKTSGFMQDPAFVAKMSQLQQDKTGMAMQMAMQDPRVLSALGVMMGIDLDAMAKEEAAEEKEKPTPKSEPVEIKTAKEDEVMEEEPEDEETLAARKAAEEALREKELGNAAYKQRQFEKALEHYDRAFQLDPQNPALLTNRAAVEFEQQNFDACIATCEKAVELARSVRADYKLVAKALARAGNACHKADRLDEAIAYLQKALTEHRTADVLTKLKEVQKEKETRDKQSYIDPALAEQAREAGNTLFKQGDYAAAVQQYTEATRRLPTDARAFSNRAACYTKLAAFEEALKDCKTAIQLDPSFVKSYIRKAAIEFLKKEYDNCLETCQEALRHDTEGKHRQEIEAQRVKCYEAMRTNTQGDDKEVLERAMKDPEVQQIMRDPVMQSILQQMQSDPRAIQEHMKNPSIASKMRKLMSAGVLRMA